MKKHWKELFFILPSLSVAIAAILGFRLNIPEFLPITYPEKNVVKAAEESPAPDNGVGENVDSPDDNSKKKLKKVNYTGDSTWKDGTYTGSGTGFGGLIKVRVTIAEGKITEIQILASAGETPSYLAQAKAMISRIITAQSPNVDTVSGATYSSNGIRTAVMQALNKAGGSQPTDPQPEPAVRNQEKSTKKKTSSVPKGQPADGVYAGSAVCEQFGYTIHLKVRFHDGKATSLYGLNITGNEDKANEAYWKKAWKGMVKKILKAQSTAVDVVSGATYSSNAISEAYQNARAKAIGAGKTKNKSKKKGKRATPSPAPMALPNDMPQITGTAKDGVYTVSAICEPDERKAFAAYTLTADVTFAEGKCTSIDHFSSTDESNRSYYRKAADGTAKASGVVAQILAKQSSSGISAVSGATCSSKTIRTLYLKALSEATGGTQAAVTEDGDAPLAVQTPIPLPGDGAFPTASPTSSVTGGDSAGTRIKDGTYTASAMVVADDWEEFADYNLTADVTFSEGKLTGIANLVLGDPANEWYCNAAANGYGTQTGIVQQLIRRQNGEADAVSGATCSSLALIQIYKNALEMAME